MQIFKITFIALLSTFIYGVEASHEKDAHEKVELIPTPIYYGKILEIKGARGYKYLKIDENGTQLWVAIANAPVAIGERIGYDKQTIMHNFESKSLGKKFKEIIFASDVYLPPKVEKPKSMKEMLGLLAKTADTNDPHKELNMGISPAEDTLKPTKPFVKKDFYTVEEVHIFRDELKDQIISVKASVFKVSHQIMKMDWTHLGDGTGNEKKLTDDLVFTSTSTSLKAGDKVIAKGKVVVNKDFGYGYFYKVIIQDAVFEAEK